MKFDELLQYAIVNECSDIHITVGTHLAVRRFGTLQIIDPEPSREEARAMIDELMTPEQIEGNVREFYNTIIKLKPTTAKGTYVKSVYLSSTMSQGIKLDVKSLDEN